MPEQKEKRPHEGEKELIPMVPWIYDLILWTLSILIDLFFREVHPRGSWKIPRRGPVIFVVAPHANQVSTMLDDFYLTLFLMLLLPVRGSFNPHARHQNGSGSPHRLAHC